MCEANSSDLDLVGSRQQSVCQQEMEQSSQGTVVSLSALLIVFLISDTTGRKSVRTT